MSETLQIRSHRGPYRVLFESAPPFESLLADGQGPRRHFIIDARVKDLYSGALAPVFASGQPLLIHASEPAKSLERVPIYVEHLLGNGIRKGEIIVAIGGGIVQDITCFLAAVLLRGLEWQFAPTTLLAQADSCIGSKSSINVGRFKNVVGTFTPPSEVRINPKVLATLDPVDMRSGIGEMLKVHAIDSPSAFDQIAAEYHRLTTDEGVLLDFIERSLCLKRRLIEMDEFDEGPRRVMNYGHSFGHAIESATDFAVPHGIAVTIGMDMANFAASRLGLTPESHFARMHPTLASNYRGFEETPVPLQPLLAAMGRDKKNVGARLVLILPDQTGQVGLVAVDRDARFEAICQEYLTRVRLSR